MRIKTNVIIATLLILIFNLGLIASIDNNIVSVLYIISMLLLSNALRKRYGIEVR
jgi:hypothetical protein